MIKVILEYISGTLMRGNESMCGEIDRCSLKKIYVT